MACVLNCKLLWNSKCSLLKNIVITLHDCVNRLQIKKKKFEEKIWKSPESTFILHCDLYLVVERPAAVNNLTWGGDLLSPIVNFPRFTKWTIS